MSQENEKSFFIGSPQFIAQYKEIMRKQIIYLRRPIELN